MPPLVAPRTPSLQVAAVTKDYALGTYGPVLLQRWQLSTPVEGAHKARALARSLAISGYSSTATLIIVPETSAMPTADARRGLANMPVDLPGCVGLALVRGGDGFRAASVRAIMTGMMSFERRAPYKIFATRPEACAWLVRQLEARWSASALEDADEQLFTRWRDQP
jgi:hypothetical protein